MLTGTDSVESSLITILPVFLPLCISRKGFSTSDIPYSSNGDGNLISPLAYISSVAFRECSMISALDSMIGCISMAENETFLANMDMDSFELAYMSACPISMKRPKGAMHSKEATSAFPDRELSTTSTPRFCVFRMISSAKTVSLL